MLCLSLPCFTLLGLALPWFAWLYLALPCFTLLGLTLLMRFPFHCYSGFAFLLGAFFALVAHFFDFLRILSYLAFLSGFFRFLERFFEAWGEFGQRFWEVFSMISGAYIEKRDFVKISVSPRREQENQGFELRENDQQTIKKAMRFCDRKGLAKKSFKNLIWERLGLHLGGFWEGFRASWGLLGCFGASFFHACIWSGLQKCSWRHQGWILFRF